MINDVQNLKTVPAGSSCGGQTTQTTDSTDHLPILRLNRAASVAPSREQLGAMSLSTSRAGRAELMI